MKGAALTEPSCKHSWCGTNGTVKFFGPGEEGYVLTANNHRYSLYGRENEEPGAELQLANENILVMPTGFAFSL